MLALSGVLPLLHGDMVLTENQGGELVSFGVIHKLTDLYRIGGLQGPFQPLPNLVICVLSSFFPVAFLHMRASYLL